uniref:Tyrosine--tRNA ligase n=1 Tax=Coccidioides posadasii RMSCC 3488 TaxID=454284 RepID=A0A0J6I267_COCPO|nr:tyrosyl-tRNA synthetase [Coccidioides posadasii RMSCC 3488]
MGSELSPQEKLDLIKLNLQEVLKSEILEDIIIRQNRAPVIYWGTASTGRIHLGYLVPIVKLAHFLRAGCHIKILLADIHGFLDNLKAPIELVNFRAEYYRHSITALLEAVHVPTDKLEFVLGSSYQLSPKYTMDLFRLSSVVTEHDAKKAGAEVVKQALDEEHLGVDAQFGGVDQRKIFTLAMETLPRVGYKERAHLMNPMVPGLAGGKMSASDPDSKIDILDTPDVVKKKLKKAFAAPRETEGNGIVSFVEYVLLPVSALENPEGKGKFTVDRSEEEGGPLVYDNIESLKEDYRADKLTPQLLKFAVTSALNNLLAPIQASFQANSVWQEVTKKAYPPPPEPEKKKKKVKDKGSRHPGAAKNVVAQPDGSVEGPESSKVAVGAGVEDAMEKLDMKK